MSLILDGTNGLSDVDGSAATPAIRGSDANTGVFFGTDIVGVSTDGTERVRVDASGNVGIGTSSPANTLDVAGSIYASGDLYIGTTDTDPVVNNVEGVLIKDTGRSYFSNGGSTVVRVNRLQDGNVMSFSSEGNVEGSISISGTTVTYGGGHLARWSRLPSEERADIPKGTVLTNLDAMVVWQKPDGTIKANEQLNQTEISSVDGDPNVAGVFDHWDNDDEQGYNSDFFVALTGDFIIRIAQGVTVQRGDLLMSAGDGTAKPQGDDIVRSKTIAKVTSTHVTCTYADGSFCVPCVLMAC